jgi:hypothetical protein
VIVQKRTKEEQLVGATAGNQPCCCFKHKGDIAIWVPNAYDFFALIMKTNEIILLLGFLAVNRLT